jgi:hypothetical protein
MCFLLLHPLPCPLHPPTAFLHHPTTLATLHLSHCLTACTIHAPGTTPPTRAALPLPPRYLEQREIMLAKLRDTTKAGDDEITRNLVRLARTRPDIFGSTQEEVSQAVTSSIKEKQTSGGWACRACAGVLLCMHDPLHVRGINPYHK